MTKKNNNAAPIDHKPFREEDLPTFQAERTETNGSVFVPLDEVGQEFTGVFIRREEKGTQPANLEWPGFLFAEYPSGDLKVLPRNFGIAEKIENMEDRDEAFERVVMRIKLEKIKITDEGTKKEKRVKLFHFQFMALSEAQAARFLENITWTDQFPA